jgi:6-phosphofructokinase
MKSDPSLLKACVRTNARRTPKRRFEVGFPGYSEIRERKQEGLSEGYWREFRVFTNEPRHQIRATAPSSSDTIIAKRLGTLAVDGAMAGYDDFMISQWLTEYVMVPLRLVVLGRKRYSSIRRVL